MKKLFLLILFLNFFFLINCENKIESAKSPEEKLKALVEEHFDVESVKVNKGVNNDKYIVVVLTEPKDSIISGTSEWMLIMNDVTDLINDVVKYKLADKVETIKISFQYVSSDGSKYVPVMININHFPEKELPFGVYSLVANFVQINIPNFQFRNWFCDFAKDKEVPYPNDTIMEWCYIRAQCKQAKEKFGFIPPKCRNYLVD